MVLIVTVLLLFVININEPCETAAATRTGFHRSMRDKWSVECTLDDDEKDAYCVPISNCEYLRETRNETHIRTRYCGPSNENRNNRHVCCEKKFIRTDATPPNFPCGYQKVITNTRIIGGDDAEVGEFPWLARILRRDNQGDINFGCTGTLISTQHVLTAAHCLISSQLALLGYLYAVSLGEQKTECNSPESDCFQNTKTVTIGNYVAHCGYDNENHDNDIGLIQLKEKVEFTDFIVPICLLKWDVNPLEYYISGWGVTEHGKVSTTKKKTTLYPFSWSECVARYQTVMVNITPRQLCVGGFQGKDSCQGDSGGPLMVHVNDTWFAAGVVSFGLKCGKQGWPGIYANLANYTDWIKLHMLDLNVC